MYSVETARLKYSEKLPLKTDKWLWILVIDLKKDFDSVDNEVLVLKFYV